MYIFLISLKGININYPRVNLQKISQFPEQLSLSRFLLYSTIDTYKREL